MRSPLAILILIAGVLLLPIGFFAVVIAFDDPCGHAIIAIVPAPNNETEAIIQASDCGVLAGPATHVFVRAGGDRSAPRSGDSVVVIDANHGAAPTDRQGFPEVSVRWLDARSLEITSHRLARLFGKRDAAGETRIVYRMID